MPLPSPKTKLKPSTLKFFGWLAMFSAISAMPSLLLTLQALGKRDPDSIMTQLGLLIMGTVVFVTLTLALRSFLNRNLSFARANAIISGMIVLNIVYAAVSGTALFNPGLAGQIDTLEYALVFLLGLIQIGFGVRLLSLDNDLNRMKRPYCILNILTGICLCSIYLVIFGVITSAVADVMLATIFFHEAKQALDIQA